MNRRLFWKLYVALAIGTVALFYAINTLIPGSKEGTNSLANKDQEQLNAWAQEAEHLYETGDESGLRRWLNTLTAQENTWAAVIKSDLKGIAGSPLQQRPDESSWLGQSAEGQIYPYFGSNPIIEIPFTQKGTHFLIVLPDRMWPEVHWGQTNFALQIVFPVILLTLLSVLLYGHIMAPLRLLKKATDAFTKGQFDVRISKKLGNRNDELSELATTFDKMAISVGELVVNQRQLVSDLSHELRTPLTRLDIAVEGLNSEANHVCGTDCRETSDGKCLYATNFERITRESQNIRRMLEDTLTLARLENQRPTVQRESLDLVDLIDVLLDDARFEFPDRELKAVLPDCCPIDNSNLRALEQALENIIRNALRYTPAGKTVTVVLKHTNLVYQITVSDQGPGVPVKNLEKIFQPFFRVDDSRPAEASGFGLGLALARRQLEAVGGKLSASNLENRGQESGLKMTVTLPRR